MLLPPDLLPTRVYASSTIRSIGLLAGVRAFGSTMGVATGYIFPQKDRPAYKVGFWVLFACTCFTGVGAAIVTFLNVRENRRRDAKTSPPPTDRVIDFDEGGLMERHPHWRFYR